MVRRSAGSRATVALDVSEASERRDPRCRSRVNATGLVVAGCTRHSSVPGLAQPGARGPDERTGTRERKLALARNPAHAVRQRLSLVGQFDESLKPFQIGSASGYGGRIMKATQLLSNLGQSLWLDNITRDLLDTGTLQRYIDDFSVTGLTSNPTIFEHAIKTSRSYDAPIQEQLVRGKSGEELFFDLALEDITRAADLFRPIHDRTNGVDGGGSVEGKVAVALRNQLGIRIAKCTYKTARDLLSSPRWHRVYNAGARPQRVLWASTGTKDPAVSDILYVKALAAPFTVNTMPERTL